MKREAIAVVVFSVIATIGARALPNQITRPATAAPQTEPACNWIPGDLHVSSEGSSPGDLVGATDPLSLAELAAIASSRALRHLAVVASRPDEVVTDSTFGSGELNWLLGTQVTFPDRSVVGFGPTLSYTDPSDSPAGFHQFAGDIRRSNGVVQLTDVETSRWPRRFLEAVAPDTVEVWRGGAFSYATQGLHKDSARALRFYDRLLDDEMRVAVAGGSDASQRALSDVAGPGQPTTWVCVDALGPAAVADAISAGRTTISNDPPVAKGAFLTLDADQDGDGTFEEQMGGAVPPGTDIRITVKGAPAARLRLIGSRSKLIDEFITDSFEYSTTIQAPADTSWLRAELYLDESLSSTNQRTCPRPKTLQAEVGQTVGYCGGLTPMLALSSPIYIQ